MRAFTFTFTFTLAALAGLALSAAAATQTPEPWAPVTPESLDATEVMPEPAPGPRPWLSTNQCLDPDLARGFAYINGEELLVDGGRRKYRILLAEHCTDLGHAVRVGFRGDTITGKICGRMGEKVVLDRMTCRIDAVEVIDDATYREARNRKRSTVSAGAGKD